MSLSRVLQVKRTETDAGVVLLHVMADNDSSLDLTLKATEGTAPYGCQVNNDQVNDLQSSNHKGKDDEWRTILGWLLLGRSPATTYQTIAKQVELVATVSPDKHITFIIRQNIVGITHRLGNIKLPYNDEVEIELFDWNVLAANDRDDAERKAQDIQERFHDQQKTLDKLNIQLQELVEAKKQHEDELLEKFRHLLNSKKAKIRDQMRLLSTAKVDQATAKKVRTTRGESQTPAPASKPRRRPNAKRKAQVEDDEEDDEAYQTQESKMANEDPDTDRDIIHTPDQNTTESEDDGDGDGTATPPSSHLGVVSQAQLLPTASNKKTTTRASKPQIPADEESSDSGFEAAPPASQSHPSRAKASQASQSQQKQKSPPEIPPRRELPFGKGRKSGKSGPVPKKLPPVIDDDETDDEL